MLAGIAGGKVFTGEEIGEFAGEFIGGAGPGVFAGVVGAEVRMVGGAGSAALAAVGEGETTQGLAVLWTKRGHGVAPKVELELKTPRRTRGVILTKNIISG